MGARQQGAALLVMLAIIVLGISYLLVSRVNTASGFAAIDRERNGQLLHQAKQALIGHVAHIAAQQTEANPGRVPCPEAPGNFGTVNEGIAAGNCTLPAVGRLPWRTLGLDKLVDASGEPLWYVVSPGWALSNSTTPPLTTFINSNSAGGLTVDAAASDSVALIIAPGPAFTVGAAGACAAWSQVRPTSGTPDRRNYLECENAAAATFVTRGPSGSFNDQLVRVTTADLLPAIEAAIAHRIERDIAPQLRQVYTAASGWERSPGVALPAGTSLFPFAAAFSDPEASADPDPDPLRPDRSVYQGAAGTYAGLAPLARHVPGSIAWINPATASVTLLGGQPFSVVSSVDCTASTATVLRCDIVYAVAPIIAVDVDAANIGTGFRQAPGIQSNLVITPGLGNASGTLSNSLRPDGSARVRITLTTSLVGLLGSFTVQLTLNAAEHPVIDDLATANAWYLRNEWHKLSLYAVSQGFAPASAGACGGANPACLTIQDARYPAATRHAILLLAGRTLSSIGQTRPNSTLANYLEGENVLPLDETFRRGAASRTINDRVVAVAP